MKNEFRDILLQTAFNTGSPREFTDRIKFAEEVLVHLEKKGMDRMKRYSRAEIGLLLKKLSKALGRPKIYRVSYKKGIMFR